MKYILNTVSANYGNMLTVAASSLFLSFIPLLPKQILLNNFISDMPLFAVATDNVDPEFTKRPRRWNIKLIGNFMLFFGLISSFFDLMLILPMIYVWKFSPEVFRTAWFLESALSEMIVTFAIRTQRPFFKSSPSKLLILSTVFCVVGAVLLVILDFGHKLFEFTTMPIYLWGWIGVVLVSYFALTEIVKLSFFKKYEL
jgi:Mg2+-importing ATPase